MNYRHAFHAGNFADLVKHGALAELMALATQGTAPLTVIDTHAGAGLYDLAGAEARRTGEAEAGIVRLMAATDAPPAFDRLKAAVSGLNGKGEVRRYPGSPWLIAGALRTQDRYMACEVRPDDHGHLTRTLKDRRNAQALRADGYRTAADRTPPTGRVLVLIDPPFEAPDDYRRIVETAGRVIARNRTAMLLVWLPLKDLETLDAFRRDLEDAVPGRKTLIEARIRPLTDPLRMNGCALVAVNTPAALEAPVRDICAWVQDRLGEGGPVFVSTLA